MMANRQQAGRMVVVFFGLTASGKSYLSAAWASLREAPRFNTDVVRKSLAAQDPDAPRDQGLDRGIYSREFSRKTYEMLIIKAHQVLAAGASSCVVLDGSYHLQRERRKVVARLSGLAAVYFVHCSCGEAVTRERLAARRLDASAVSDGTMEVYLGQREKFEPPTEIPSERLLELDTDAPLEYLIARLELFLPSSPAA